MTEIPRSPVVADTASRTTDSAAQAKPPAWLAGCWMRTGAKSVVTEQWSVPRAGMMLGTGHTTRGDSTLEWEQTRIVSRGTKLVYEARPSGQATAEFVATPNDTLVAFENPEHDFPQRVIYRKRGTDSLIARIEGTMNGRARAIDFPYTRVSCESSSR